MKGAISVLIKVKGGTQEFADNLAMAVVSANPSYLSISEVKPEDLEAERKVQEESAKEDPSFAKKPANIQAKILEGRVNKHFEAQVFSFAEYILDPSKTVGQVLKEEKVTPISFVMFKVGEGIEKKKEDFAAEVAKELN